VLAQAVVHEVDVVAMLADRGEAFVAAAAPLQDEARTVLGAQEVLGDQVIVLVILDEEDPQGGVGRGHGGPSGSSTISNQ
jgi:hypothetical protein